MFFLLSGFGMTLGYEALMRERKIDFGTYIKKRLIKIYPIYFETLILATLLGFIYQKFNHNTIPYFDVYHFFLNVFCIQSGIFETTLSYNGVAWYISVLMMMYIVHYIIVKIFSERIFSEDYKYIYLGTAIIGFALEITSCNFPLCNSMTNRGIGGYFIGCVLAKMYLEISENNKYKKIIEGYIALVVALIIWCIGYLNDKAIGNVQMVSEMFLFPLTVYAIMHINWLGRIFTFWPFKYLGKISLSLYLIHNLYFDLLMHIDKLYTLEINYSSKKIWILIFTSTVLLSIGNNLFVNTIQKKSLTILSNISRKRSVE